MPRVLVVTDEPWIRNEVHAALADPGFVLVDHADPASVPETVRSEAIDLVLADLQVGNMGGMAVTRALRGDTEINGGDVTPVVLLLDRSADAFLARRAGATGWITKPFTAHDLRRALEQATVPAGDAG
jgi:DNA-binding response OmpR family regulator